MGLELFKTPLAIDANLKGLWRFESGVLTTDSSGNSHTLTAVSDPAEVAGQFGGAVDFDGNDSYTITNHADFNVAGSFSISAWIKHTSSPGYATVLMKGGSGGDASYSYALQVDTSKSTALLWQTAGAPHMTIQNTATVNDGNWHHLCMTYDGTTLRLYVDAGTPATTTTKSGSWNNGTSNLGIGGRPGGVGFLTGSLDDVAFFNRVLTDAEVLSIYSGGGWPATTNYLTNYRPRKRTPGAVSV